MNLEHPIIKKATEESPELFSKQPFVEDGEALVPFGIHIPKKDSLPKGYIKLFPEEFIVEEIDMNGQAVTIDYENVLTTDSAIPGAGDTIYATLVKCNMSTLEVIREFSTKLGIDVKSIGYAGIKDKYAITAQRISIRNADEKLVRALQSPFYFLKDVSRDKGAISMASLKGNRFGIFVRTETGANVEQIQTTEESFLNYFYLQRFGSPRFINYEWGYDILKGNYQKAVESVLFKQSAREIGYINKLRAEAETKKTWTEVKKVFEPVLDIMHSEAPMLDHLIAQPTDFKGALTKIPDQVQLWLYGLASLLFNEKISYAVQRDINPPVALPFFLSNEKADIDAYREELVALGIFPPPFQNLRAFPFIRLAHRTANAVETASSLSMTATAHGFRISFDLPKGAYATTFLSHHVNIVADAVPENISKERASAEEVSDNPLRQRTFQLFKEVIAAETSVSAE